MKPEPEKTRPPREDSVHDLFWALLYRLALIALFAGAGSVWALGLYPKKWECGNESATASVKCKCSGVETRIYSACPWDKNAKCDHVTYCLGIIKQRY